MSDDDPVVIDPGQAEFEEWRDNLLSGMRRLCTFALLVQCAAVVFVIEEGLWVNLSGMLTALFMLIGSRFLISKRGQTMLQQLRDSS